MSGHGRPVTGEMDRNEIGRDRSWGCLHGTDSIVMMILRRTNNRGVIDESIAVAFEGRLAVLSSITALEILRLCPSLKIFVSGQL